VLAGRSAEISPQVYARFGGVLYLIIIGAGATGELSVKGGRRRTRQRRGDGPQHHGVPVVVAGRYCDLVRHVCDVSLMAILYVLLRPVNNNLALLAVLFNVTQTAVLIANKFDLPLPIFLLGDGEYLKAFAPEQLQALSYVSLRTHDHGFAEGLVFFGRRASWSVT
jgi:hypothetical protein